MASGFSNFMERFSVLQRLGIYGGLALGLLAMGGIVNFAVNAPKEKPFYTPGQVPSREDCFYGKLSQFKNVTRQIIFQVGLECEVEVQSLEVHEQKRQEWVERQAEKARQRAAEPVVEAPVEEPKEKDTLRRVWR